MSATSPKQIDGALRSSTPPQTPRVASEGRGSTPSPAGFGFDEEESDEDAAATARSEEDVDMDFFGEYMTDLAIRNAGAIPAKLWSELARLVAFIAILEVYEGDLGRLVDMKNVLPDGQGKGLKTRMFEASMRIAKAFPALLKNTSVPCAIRTAALVQFYKDHLSAKFGPEANPAAIVNRTRLKLSTPLSILPPESWWRMGRETVAYVRDLDAKFIATKLDKQGRLFSGIDIVRAVEDFQNESTKPKDGSESSSKSMPTGWWAFLLYGKPGNMRYDTTPTLANAHRGKDLDSLNKVAKPKPAAQSTAVARESMGAEIKDFQRSMENNKYMERLLKAGEVARRENKNEFEEEFMTQVRSEMKKRQKQQEEE